MKKSKVKAKKLARKTIVHIVTGSIAAYKAGDLVTACREQGARVLCVLTESAKKFVTPLVMRALSGEHVYDDFFSAETPFDVVHTSLAEKADIVLVSPASANFIARLACGLADDLASCTVLATRKPVVICPAMNDAMWEHPMTRRNVMKLKAVGYEFVEPIQGHLVCGKEAMGHISDPDNIVRKLTSLKRKKK